MSAGRQIPGAAGVDSLLKVEKHEKYGTIMVRSYALSRFVLVCLFAAFVLAIPPQSIGQDGVEATKPQKKESSREALLIYAEAASYQNNKQFDLAATEWAKFLDNHKDDPRATEALYNLAICQIQQSGFKEASENLQRVIEKKDADFERIEDAYLNLGWSQYSVALQNQPEWFDEAASTFATLLSKFPDSKFRDQALFFGGESLYLQGKFEEAVRSYAELVENHDDSDLHADAMYALGVTMEDLRKYKDAGEIFDGFLKLHPKHDLATEVKMRKAETILQQGNFEAAEKLFREVASVSNYRSVDHAKYRHAFCIAAQADALGKEKGDDPKIQEQQRVSYRAAAAIFADIAENMQESPYAKDSRMAAGRSLYRAKDFDAASKWFTQVVSSDSPDAPEAAHWLARILLNAGDVAKARDVVASVMKTASESKNSYLVSLKLDAADAMYKDDASKKDSVGAYLKIADEHPSHRLAPKSVYNAAYGAMEVKEYETGLAYAERFKKNYPDHKLLPEVQKVVAECRLQLGQLDAAAADFKDLAASGDKEAAKFELRRGLSLYLNKNYDEAIPALSAVLGSAETADQKAEAAYWLGRAHADSGQQEPAIKAFETSIAANPKWKQHDEVLLNYARALRKAERIGDAQKAILRLIATYPNSKILDQAYYRLAEFAYTTGDYDSAIENYSTVLADYPESSLIPFCLYGRGWSQLRSKKAGSGQADFDALVRNFSKHELAAQAIYGRGMAAHQNGDFEAGLQSVEEYLKDNPGGSNASDARYLKGICLVGLKKIPDAVKAFGDLLRTDPEYAGKDKVLYELAWAYKSGKDDQKAIASFTTLVSVAPQSPLAAEASYHLGEDLYGKKKYEEAIPRYETAGKLASSKDLREKAAYKLGWSHYQTGDFEKAVVSFDEQLKISDVGNLAADAEFMRAESYFKQELYEEALKSYDRARQKPSKNPTMQALTMLHGGQAAGQLKKWESSYEWLTGMLETFPKSPYIPQATYERGWAERNLGELEAALKSFTSVSSSSRNELGARARFMVGEILFEQKKYSPAILEFRRLMFGYGGENAPDSIKKWQAKAGFEAGRCASILASQNASQRGELIQAARSFFTYVVVKHPQASEAGPAKEELDKLGPAGNQARRP